jgi:hypothetical protein
MATSPCSVDTKLTDIKGAQDELTALLGPGAKDALASITAKANEIGEKLNDFKPEVEENPNLQKKLQELNGKSPNEALELVTEIQNEFGPVVEDLQEILNEVSPDLQSIVSDIQGLFSSSGGTGTIADITSGGDLASLISKVSKVTAIDTATICEKCSNIEIKTLEDGTKVSQEAPTPPQVPQTVPVTEPTKPPQSFKEQNERKWAEVLWLESQNATRQTLLNVYKQRPKPPEISDIEFAKQSNRFWANYTFLYTAYGNLITPTVTPAGGLNDWPWRETWAPLNIATDPKYVGEPPINQTILINLHERLYNENNTTEYSFAEATQFWYDRASETAKIGIGVGKPFYKEI